MTNRFARLLFLSLGIHLALPLAVLADSANTGPAPTDSASVLNANSPSEPNSLSVGDKGTLVIDLSTRSTLNLSGNLTNAGTIYAISTNPAITSGTISAANIFNLAGATITTILPSGGLPGFANPISNFSLVLQAGSIANAGIISSAGNLSMTASTAISNSGTMTALGSLCAQAPSIQNLTASATMQAMSNISMVTASLVNQGIISSTAADINVISNIATSLSVNNTAGILQALNGSVNFGAKEILSKIDTTVYGGDIISKQLNVFSGCGTADVDVNQLTGDLNIYAGEAKVNAATNTLALGSIHLSGDPTFYNRTGDIVINTDLIFPGANLAVIAEGDIITASGAGRIDTSSTTGNGGELTLIAGANFTTTGTCCVKPGQPGDTTSILTLSGPSSTGGNIDLSSGTQITALTSQSSGGGNGGNITILAFADANGITGSGKVILPHGVTIQSGGSGSGNNGNVTIYAGTTSGTGIDIGGINASGGSGTSATVQLATNNPGFTGGPAGCDTCMTIQNGAITSGAVTTAYYPGVAQAAGMIVAGSVNADGGGSAAGGTIYIYSNSSSLMTLGSLTGNGIAGDLSARGGIGGGAGGYIEVTGAGSMKLSSGTNLNVAPYNGDGGSLYLGATSLTAPAVTLDGRGAASGDFNGGNIYLGVTSVATTGGPITLDASGSGTGNGGTVSTNAPVIGTGVNEVKMVATGGSIGSASGDGGSVYLNVTGVPLLVKTAGIDIRPLGLNGTGGNVAIDPYSASLVVSGNLDVSGVGTGDGGTINITLRTAPASAFVLGAVTTHGVTGSITADAGSTGTKGGTINITAEASPLTLNSFSKISAKALNGSGGNVSLTTSGKLTLPAGTLSVDGGAGNTDGGTINLSSSTMSTAGAVLFSAKASGSGNGGKVVLSTGSTLNVGPLLSFDVSGGSAGANAGNAGTVDLHGKDFTIAPAWLKMSPLGNNGNGGTLLVDSDVNIQVTAALDLSGVGFGDGGTVKLNNGTFSPSAGTSILIGGASANGVNGDIKVNAGLLGGSGGSIELQTASTGSNVNITSLSNLQITTTQGNGGSIKLTPGFNGVTNIPAGTINADAVGPGSFNGGTIFIRNNTPVSLVLSANATGDGDGGTVYIAESIGFGANQAVVHATGGSAGSAKGNGGQLTVTNMVGAVTALTVDPAAFDVRPLGSNGNGGAIELFSNSSALQVFGSLDASGVGTGNGGELRLFVAKGSLNIGDASVSGISGTMTAAGGASGTNGGAIYAQTNGTLTIGAPSAFSFGGMRGQLFLNANGAISFPTGGTVDLRSSDSGGSLLLTASSISTGANLLITADGKGTGNGGGLTLRISAGGLNLGAGAGQFFLSANSGNLGGNAGALQIETSSALNISGGFSAKVLGSNGNGAQLSFETKAGITLPATLSADGKGTGHGGTIFIEYSTAGPFTINSKITANSDTGIPGLILIQDTAATFDLRINGTVQATSATGNKGQLILNSLTNTYAFAAPELVDVNKVLTLSGTGTIDAEIYAGGKSFTATLTNPTTFAVIRTTGNINITAPSLTLLHEPSVTANNDIYTGYNHGWGGPFTTYAQWSTLGMFGAIQSDGSITINAPVINNNGTISSTKNGAVNIIAPSLLTVNGSGQFSTVGGNLTLSAGSINILDSSSFSAGIGTVNFTVGATGNITAAPCTIQAIVSASAVTVTTPQLDFSNSLSLVNVGLNSPVTFKSPVGANLNITVDNLQPAIVRTNGGGINFQAAPGANINLTPNGTANLNFLGGPVTFTTSGGTVNIANGLTLTANNNLTFQVNNGGVVNNGSVISTGGTFSGSISIASTGSATVSGTGTFSAGVANGLGQINFNAASSLSIGGSVTVMPGTGGGVGISAASVTLLPAANLTIADNALTRIDTDNMIFGASSQLTLQSKTGSFYIGSGAAPLTVTLPSGSTGTILSNGVPIVIRTVFGGNNITFASSSVGKAARLDLLGASSATIAQTQIIQVDAGVTLFSDSAFGLATNSALTNNGTISAGGVAPSIAIGSFGALAINGTGTIATVGSGSIAVTSFFGQNVQLNGNQSFDPGSSGTVALSSGGQSIVFAPGTTQRILQGSSATFTAAAIALGNGASIVANAPPTNVIFSANMISGLTVVPGGPLTITLPSGGSSSVVTSGGDIQFTGFQSLALNTSGAAASALSLNGGAVTIDGPSVSLAAGANITSDHAVTINASSSGLALTSDITSATTLSVTASGQITRTAGTLTAADLVLSTKAGADIGASGQEVSTNSDTLLINSTGSSYINETDSVSLKGSSIGSLELNTGSNGSIDLSGNITATGTIKLNAAGTGNITNTGKYLLKADTLVIYSQGGDIGSPNAVIKTDSKTLSLGTTGNAYVSAGTTAVSVGKTDVGGLLSLGTTVDLSVSAPLTAGTVDLTASGSANVTLTADVTATNKVSIVSAGGMVDILGQSTLTSKVSDVHVQSAKINNDGLISAPGASANILLDSPTASLAISGIGSVAANGNNSSITATATNLSLADQKFDTGATGKLSLSATSNLDLSGAVSVTGGSKVDLSAPVLSFSAGAKLDAPGAVLTAVGPAAGLNIQVADNTTSDISSGTISFSSPGGISFTKSAGGNSATLNLTTATVQIAPGNNSLSVSQQVVLSATANINTGATSIQNDGTISATGALNISNNSSISVTGAGSITGGTAQISSGNGSVNLTQSNVSSTLSGSAQNDFIVNVSGATLSVDSVSAATGQITLANTAGSLTVNDNASVSAATNVNLTGSTGINVGTVTGGSSISAGQLDPLMNANSTTMADFDVSAVTSPGSISLNTAGQISLATASNLRTAGGSIGLTAHSDINIGGNSQLFAQGGNIWLNGLGNINIAAGTSFTAVARNLTNGTVVPILGANTSVAAYVGGSIALDVNILQPNYDSYLRTNWEQQRTAAGSASTTGGGIDTSGSNLLFANGGTVALVTSNPNKVSGTFLNVLGSSINADGGVIYIDPPGSQVNVNNANFQAIGPQLVAAPPPVVMPVLVPVGTATPVALLPVLGTSNTSGLALIGADSIASADHQVSQTQSARIVPLDTIDLNVPLATPGGKENICVPAPLAQFAETPDTESGWSVASGFCEAFAMEGANGTSLVGSGGTQLAPLEGNGLRMKHGTLLAMSGKNGFAVETGNAKVNIAPDSAMIIEETKTGMVRITQMAGAQTAIEVSRNGQRHSMPIQAGQEVLISVGDSDQEELIAVDGIDRVPVGASIKMADLHVRKSQVNTKQLLERNPLMNCTSSSCVPARLRAKINKMRAEAALKRPQQTPLTSTPIELAHPYKTVGFVQTAVPAISPVSTFTTSTGCVRHSADAKFTLVRPGVLILREGEVLISADKPTKVSSGANRVDLGAGSVAIVKSRASSMTVQVLWEQSGSQVVASAGNNFVKVRCGQEAVLASSSSVLNEIVNADKKARRRVMKVPSNSGQAILLSDVSFLSSAGLSDVLSSVLKSAHPDDKSITAKILKMAVVLSVVTSKHGGYKPIKGEY